MYRKREREDHAHRGEDSDGVGVADRQEEQAALVGVGRPSVREEICREGRAAHRHDSCQQPDRGKPQPFAVEVRAWRPRRLRGRGPHARARERPRSPRWAAWRWPRSRSETPRANRASTTPVARGRRASRRAAQRARHRGSEPAPPPRGGIEATVGACDPDHQGCGQNEARDLLPCNVDPRAAAMATAPGHAPAPASSNEHLLWPRHRSGGRAHRVHREPEHGRRRCRRTPSRPCCPGHPIRCRHSDTSCSRPVAVRSSRR